MFEAKLIAGLKAKQAEIARSALTQSGGRDAFEYGKWSGVYAGLEMALQEIEAILNDIREEDDELPRKSRAGR